MPFGTFFYCRFCISLIVARQDKVFFGQHEQVFRKPFFFHSSFSSPSSKGMSLYSLMNIFNLYLTILTNSFAFALSSLLAVWSWRTASRSFSSLGSCKDVQNQFRNQNGIHIIKIKTFFISHIYKTKIRHKAYKGFVTTVKRRINRQIK